MMKCKRRKAVLATRAALCESREGRHGFERMLTYEAGLHRASFRRLAISYAASHLRIVTMLGNHVRPKDLRTRFRRERERWMRLMDG